MTGFPTHHPADLRSRQILVGYLVVGGGPDVRFQLSPSCSLQHFDQLQDGERTFGREVERLASKCRVFGDRLGKL